MHLISYLLILVTFLDRFAEIYETLQNKEKSKNKKLYCTKENEDLALLRISALVHFFHDNFHDNHYVHIIFIMIH